MLGLGKKLSLLDHLLFLLILIMSLVKFNILITLNEADFVIEWILTNNQSEHFKMKYTLFLTTWTPFGMAKSNLLNGVGRV